MRVLRLLIPVVLALGVLVVAAPATASAAHYYVALGDSLARGYMPSGGDTDQGYADDLYATLHAQDPSLQLVKLGCSGETTTTMITGGICSYDAGSQLAAATGFLRAHAGDVTYVTLDIGANDVDSCAPAGSIDTACLGRGVQTITKNLAKILKALRAADGGKPRSVGMNYYDPFLQYWLTGRQGQLVATASVGLLDMINTVETVEYVLFGYRIADVAAAYKTAQFVPFTNAPGYGRIPRNVARICALTYMCSVHNIHPNVQGYQVIADAFARRLGVTPAG